MSGIAFRAGDSDQQPIGQTIRGIAATDHGRDPKFTGNDGRMASPPASIRDDCGGPLHHRFPIWVGHVRHQYVAGLNTAHFRRVRNHSHRSGTDLLANGAPGSQDG